MAGSICTDGRRRRHAAADAWQSRAAPGTAGGWAQPNPTDGGFAAVAPGITPGKIEGRPRFAEPALSLDTLREGIR